MSADSEKDKDSSCEYKLKPEEELRVEVADSAPALSQLTDAERGIVLELKDGLAEVFGTELVCGNKYVFGPGSKFAVFSWYGCTLSVTGTPEIAYVAKETPMVVYLNTHAALETLRKRAEKDDKKGPTVMLVGPTDVGKSTVARILLNYAVRVGRSPIFIDLDVGQGSLAIPGTIGAVLVEQPSPPNEFFVQKAPLVFHYGSANMAANVKLYKELCRVMAEAVQSRFEASKKVKYSGTVINTAGWVKEEGYQCLTYAAVSFEVDVVVVLDQERLYNELVRDMPPFVQVVYQPKSAGVVERSQRSRFGSRMARLRSYFYGDARTPFYPHSFDLRFSDARIFKIGAPRVPASCLPIGMSNDDAETRLVPVTPSRDLINHMLSISFFSGIPENGMDVISTNVIGFLYITNVDMDRQVLTVLSPQPRPLPEGLLLYSDVRFIDAQ